MTNQNEIVVYQPTADLQLQVRLENETVWLTQAQIADLFAVQRPAITKHLGNIFASHELEESSVSSILEHTAQDGKTYQTKFYNLDAILSVGYRVNSLNATQFRQWANRVLKDYLLKGYAISRRVDSLERRVAKTEEQIEFFVRTALPPVEGVFFEGQVFGARVFVEDLIRSAKRGIVLIDTYVNSDVIAMLNERGMGVSATIYTDTISVALKQAEELNEKQNGRKIEIRQYKSNFHDRFLIIDDDLYHFGASFKDLGRRLFAFEKMGIDKRIILEQV